MKPRRRRLKYCWLALLGLLWFAGPVSAAQPPGQASWPLAADWGGHLRTIGTAAFLDHGAAQRLIDRDPYADGQAELRLKNRLDAGPHWTLATHYELVALGGDARENSSALADAGLPVGLRPAAGVDDERRLFDLTGIIADGERHLVYHRLDRLNLGFAPEWGRLRLGRQALTWGDGLIFNPMDLFNPFAPTAVQRDYKIGEDMAHLQLPLASGDGELLYLPRRDPESGDLAEDQASYATKLHLPTGGLELDLMGARHYGDGVLGLGSSGYLGGALWRFNATYTHVSDGGGADDFLQAVANLDYAWMWGGKNVYGLLEVYYNQLGRAGDYEAALEDEILMERVGRGELFTLGRHYLAGQLQVELHPLAQLHTTAIVNLSDPSGLVQPQLIWDVVPDWQAIIGGQWHWGARGSEFGGFDLDGSGGGRLVAPSDQVYLWLSYYF
jgi:hypothetical protein